MAASSFDAAMWPVRLGCHQGGFGAGWRVSRSCRKSKDVCEWKIVCRAVWCALTSRRRARCVNGAAQLGSGRVRSRIAATVTRQSSLVRAGSMLESYMRASVGVV